MVAVALNGCFTYNKGAVDRQAAPPPIPAEAWPAREVESVRGFYEATPEQVFRYELQSGVSLEQVDSRFAPFVRDRPDYTVHSCELNGTGLLRQYTNHTADPMLPFDRVFVGFDPNASFLTSRYVSKPWFQEQLAEAHEGESTNARQRPVAPGVRSTRMKRRIALEQGMQLRWPRELARDAADIPGILVHFTAMFGTSYEREVMGVLEERGWVVIDISTESRIKSPRRAAHAERIAALNARRDAVIREWTASEKAQHREKDPRERERLATTSNALNAERSAITHEAANLSRGSFQVCQEDQVEPVATAIAAAVDDLIAEHAYAAEAALEVVRAQFPQLAQKPVAVIGFSAGALIAPAAAARLGEAVQAVVLIGGGANLLEIAATGEFSDGGLRVRCEDDETPAPLMDLLNQAYLARSRLDPYHAAAQLRGTPVLLVRATFDEWVPASTGRLLRERLGEPDQLVHLGGHRTLFYFLPSQAGRIADWLQENVSRED